MINRIGWAATVVGTWVSMETIFWFISRRPFDWQEVLTVALVCTVAVITFPHTKAEEGQDGG